MATSDVGQFDNVSRSHSLGQAFWDRARACPEDSVLRHACSPSDGGARVWKTETYRSLGTGVARLAHFLKGLGVGPGVPVAILSQTRPDWVIADLAIQTLGGITVSIYQSQTATDAGFILHDSGARIVLIENEEQAAKIAWLQLNDCPIPEREGIAASIVRVPIDAVLSFERVDALPGAALLPQILRNEGLPSTPPPIPTTITRDSVASYVYTSGTTGPPKGVIQSHGNHLTNVEQAGHSGVFSMDGSLFLYLPLAHSFARLIHYVGCLTSSSLCIPAVADHRSSKVDLTSVARDLRESGSAVVPSVPRLFEKMGAALQARASGRSMQQRVLRLCISNAQGTYERRCKGAPLGIIERIMFDGLKPIRAKIKRELFGSNFSHAISGGAKLDPGVNKFFDALEICVCEGYGLTETCVATHVNRPTSRRIGSVGPAFERVETRILPEDGEILLRGPNVTRGYLNRPQATNDSWDEEHWFHTGDVGWMDDDGFLYITDRKKELVITAGGKKIPPTSIEGLFKRHSFISHAFLYGDGKPYCVMLFTLNEVELRALLSSAGIKVESGQKLSELSAVIGMVQDAVNRANSELASFESIKHFRILDQDFSIESGLLTPTLKLRRKQITARYLPLLSSLY